MSKLAVSALFLIILWHSGCRSLHPEATAPELDSDSSLVVYIVRHAEKAAEPAGDPPLTAEGTRRAAALAEVIDTRSLVAVFSTSYQRTRATAFPAAEAARLPVTEIPAADLPGLVERIRSYKKGRILVSGHSNTVPEIISMLGVDEEVRIGDDDYGDLFIVILPRKGSPVLERRRFGDK